MMKKFFTTLSICFAATLLLLSGLFGKAFGQSTTVSYTLQQSTFYTSNDPGGGGDYNANSNQLGMYANSTSPKQFVTWAYLGTAGGSSNNSGTQRPMKVGDVFTISLSAEQAYGEIGVSLLSSPSSENGWNDRLNNDAIAVNIDGPAYQSGYGPWYAEYSNGSTANATKNNGSANVYGNSSTYQNVVITFTLTAPDRMNVSINDQTSGSTSNLYDVLLNSSNPISQFAVYMQDDYNGSSGSANAYWGLNSSTSNTSTVSSGALSIGAGNGSFTEGNVIPNGTYASSTSAAYTNTLTKSGTGTLTLSAANTYTGGTNLSAGTIQLGIANALPGSGTVTFSGGTLSSGATAGYSDALGTALLTSNSTIALGTGSHSLSFANSAGLSWTSGKVLTITGWTGTAGSSGTAGKIFFGSATGGLTATQLSQISFSGYTAGAQQLSTGEVVPVPGPTISSVVPTSPSISGQATNTGYNGQTITINGSNLGSASSVTVGGSSVTILSNTATAITFVLPAGASGTVSVTNSYGTGTQAGFTNLGYITNASADWSTGSTWLGGSVPPASAVTTVNNTVGINSSVANAPASVTIQSGASLTLSNAASAVTATTITNNGTLAWTAAGTLTIAPGGTLTNNGTFTAGTGTVSYTGAGTVSGSSAMTFNNLTINGTVTLSTVPTINGNFQINGGNVTAAPNYGTGSTLVYNVATYGAYLEWTSGASSGAGVPYNVTIGNGTNTAVNLGSGLNYYQLNGSLTIASGSSLTQSTNTGNPGLKFAGNFTNNGTYTDNGRGTWFIGTADQTMTSASPVTLNYLLLSSAYNLQLGSSNITIGANSSALQFLSSGGIDLEAKTLTLSSGGTILLNAGGTKTIQSTGGTGTFAIAGSTAITPTSGSLTTASGVLVSLAGGLNIAGASALTVNGTLQILNGGYITTNAPVYGTGSLLQYYTGTTPYVRALEWSTASGPGYPYNVQISNNTTIDAAGTSMGFVVLDLAGSLTIDAGSALYMDYSLHNMTVPLVVNGNLNLYGNISESGTAGGDIDLGGNWVNNGSGTNFFPNGRAVGFIGSSAQTIGGTNSTAAAYAFDYLTINNTGGGVSLSKPVTVANTLTMTSGVFTTSSANSLIILNTGSTSGGSVSSYVSGPLIWDLAASVSAGSYSFPVGGSGYLPFSLSSVSTGATGPVLQVQAYNAGCSGSADGSTVSSISSTEYWSANIVSGNFTSGSVSIARQSGLGSLDAIAQSSSKTGSYASLGGTVSGDGVNNSNATGSSLGYFAFAVYLQPQGSLTANGPFCSSGTGQLTWTATEGIGPYTIVYNDGTANRTASSVVSGTPFNVYTDPVTATTTYTLVSVTDNTTMAERTSGFTAGSATITVNPLPAVVTHGVSVCTYATANLTAASVTTGSTAGLTFSYWTNSAATSSYSTPAAAVPGTYYIEGATVAGCSAVQPVIVTGIAPPAATASNTGPYIPGQTISLSSGPNGQTSYAWSGPSGYTASVQNVSRTNAISAMSGTYTVTVTNSSGCSASAGTLAVVNNLGDYTWTGATSTAWATATNWTPTAPVGGPSGCSQNVIIPVVTNYPVISTAVSIGNVTVNSNAQLTLNAPLSVCGNFTGGTATAASLLGNSHLVMAGSSGQNMSGKFNVNNMQINNSSGGVVNTATIMVSNALILTKGNLNSNSGSITLVSNADGDAYLDNFTSSTAGLYSGNLTVQRYISNTAEGYRDLSSPVATSIASLNSAYPVTGLNNVACYYAYVPYPNLQKFDESYIITAANGSFNEHWLSYTALTDPMSPMMGLAFRTYVGSPYTISFTGQPYSGPITAAITNTTTVAPANDGWNLLGNPYPSPVSWSAIKAMNSAVSGGAYYVYNATGEYTGNWGSYNGTTGVNGATNSIATSQGFFIQTALASGTFTMNNTVRTAVPGTYLDPAPAHLDNELRLVLSDAVNSDEVVTYTDPQATDAFDPALDAVKMPAGSTVNIGFDLSGYDYAINVMNTINEETVLPLTMEVAETGTYTLTATMLNIHGLHAVLYDALAGTYTDLSAGPLQMNLNGGQQYTGRYSVVFKATAASGIATLAEGNTHIYSFGNTVYVERSSSSPAMISITNMIGQKVADFSSNSSSTAYQLQAVQPWYAIVKVTEGEKITVRKVLISNN